MKSWTAQTLIGLKKRLLEAMATGELLTCPECGGKGRIDSGCSAGSSCPCDEGRCIQYPPLPCELCEGSGLVTPDA